ncbi:MAG: 23S rRNA (adenine(2503)-C(2))-methyltransferase RlmN [Myxococcales bacterium]|nr:23S rRNA (adenine(2503)-C(2))-methyltransferase RlmN [Myxococcales bacterium]
MTNDLPLDLITAIERGLLGMPKEELRRWFVQHGETTNDADRFFRWLHQRAGKSNSYFRARTDSFQPTAHTSPVRDQNSFAARLQNAADRHGGGGLTLDEQLVSTDGTRKLLFTTEDGHRVESVLIPMGDYYTQCVSSQVGCRIGCTFCLTAQMGLIRHLKSSEIISQVYWAATIPLQGLAVRNIVFMGMGEPLDNLSEVIRACNVLVDNAGLGFSQRRVTVSTAGVIPKMRELMDSTPVQLAVSLNAVTDEKRDEIMPINRRWPLIELKLALKDLKLANRRRITIEYVLLRDFNDQPEDIQGLIQFISFVRHGKVNLIPWNPFGPSRWKRPDDDVVVRFRDELLANNVSATIRESKGVDIGAACGQLDGAPKEVVITKQHRHHYPSPLPHIGPSKGNRDDLALGGLPSA